MLAIPLIEIFYSRKKKILTLIFLKLISTHIEKYFPNSNFDQMASARIVLILSISMVLLSSVAIATDHIVGDDKGWTVDFDYTQWAQDKVFRVGDNLGM